MHKLIFDEQAIKLLDKLPKAIYKKIQVTKENPHNYFIKVTDKQEYKVENRLPNTASCGVLNPDCNKIWRSD
jgi:mRNA-degrading endonuclease RelE of RelBE toxin-antitoxin system